jgi:phage shock protein PspC (stress-responsive transcriptional regulator)
MATKPTTEHTAPKTVARSTYVLSIALTFVFTAMIGTVAGYFIAISIHEDARANVVSDMQLVSKQSK